ncbi:MAG: hypothetical protein ABSA33_04800 [Candidatus Micrarchaeaceae archaeon]
MILTVFFFLGILLMLVYTLFQIGMYVQGPRAFDKMRAELRLDKELTPHDREVSYRLARRLLQRWMNYVGCTGLMLVVVICAVKLSQIS